MGLKQKVTIKTRTTTFDEEGIASDTWTTLEQVEGTLLPFGNEMDIKMFGIEANYSYRFFYKGTSENVAVGNQLVHEDGESYIVYVADYKKAKDVLLSDDWKKGAVR